MLRGAKDKKELEGQLAEARQRIAELENDLAQSATRDSLTPNLLTLRAFNSQLELDVERAQRYGRPLSLAVIDIDGFGQFNVENGYEAGDALLIEVARTISDQTRVNDIACRIGNDEFGVLYPETRARDARAGLERMVKAISVVESGGWEGMTVSAGLVPLAEEQEPQRLLAAAQTALEQARTLGGGKIVESESASEVGRDAPKLTRTGPPGGEAADNGAAETAVEAAATAALDASERGDGEAEAAAAAGTEDGVGDSATNGADEPGPEPAVEGAEEEGGGEGAAEQEADVEAGEELAGGEPEEEPGEEPEEEESTEEPEEDEEVTEEPEEDEEEAEEPEEDEEVTEEPEEDEEEAAEEAGDEAVATAEAGGGDEAHEGEDDAEPEDAEQAEAADDAEVESAEAGAAPTDELQGTVTEGAGLVARALELSAEEVDMARAVAYLDNLGVGASGEQAVQVVNGLDADAWDQVRASRADAADLVGALPGLGPVAATLRGLEEHWDGSGAPEGLKGADIPAPARAAAAVAAYHRLTAPEPVGEGLGRDEAIREIARGSGRRFDPAVVDKLIKYAFGRLS